MTCEFAQTLVRVAHPTFAVACGSVKFRAMREASLR